MPGFDTLGARLARSRRRLERERAEMNVERLAGLDTAVRGDGVSAIATASVPVPSSAQVIRFPRLSERSRD
ncbi:hypothetical protein ASE66_18290 [Bosea sp. Root483D1]|nr:hypothetical protein ASE66_18290 [Bosea sp. Root483D1]